MQRIIMTGASNGIGLNAVRRIIDKPDIRVVAGSRSGRRAMPDAIEVLPLDLSSLKSVASFAASVKENLEEEQIDVLVLNAGIASRGAVQRSIDGFDMTFAVNHLAHYYLTQLLLPVMAKNGRIIITTSDTHDPEVLSFAGGPKSLGLDELNALANGASGLGMRVYAHTKAFNLLMARYLANQDGICRDKHIQVIAYNPGATPGTGLGGSNSSDTQLFFMKNMMKGASFFNSALYPNDLDTAGKALADLALGKILLPEGQIYASLIKGKLESPAPSMFVRDDSVCKLLWQESKRMIAEGPPPSKTHEEEVSSDRQCVVQ